jgi:penicillin-binding protein 1A
MEWLRKIVRFRFLRFLAMIGSWGFTGLMVGLLLVVGVFVHYSSDLPDPGSLADYEPPIVTRLYAQDGRLMAEYATEHRLYVPLEAMPKRLISAFIAAEDKNFYEHSGVDFVSVMRAAVLNLSNLSSGANRALVGGSTITQQVVKNFLLTSEKSLERKIKEAILSFRISRNYSKERIMELYLNEIYLGRRSYGVAAAALNYFNKPLSELTIAEMAFLAGLPKGPANYDPERHYDRAIERRGYVIGRMLDDGHITPQEAETAHNSAITLRKRDSAKVAKAEFFAESVRRKLTDMYGSNVLYEGGLFVKTTLNPDMQDYADMALRYALREYDERHGYRGPVMRMENFADWRKQLAEKALSVPLYEAETLAVVDEVSAKSADILTMDYGKGTIPLSALKWARKQISDTRRGPAIQRATDVLRRGDVVIVSPFEAEKVKNGAENQPYYLRQIPKVNGALVAMDPHTGRVLAMSGGYSALHTEFNRATQARRQPGSAFKPFVYLAGLERGFNPATMIMDAPISIPQGPNKPDWTPQNYSGDFLGNATMRIGLEKSRNAMTVYLASMLGIDAIREIGRRFDIYENLPPQYSAVLGARETTLIKLVNAYSMLVNGGKRSNPAIIERIDDRYGRIIYRRDQRKCEGCQFDNEPAAEFRQTPPTILDQRETVVDEASAFQMVYMLQGVVQRGTAVRARKLNMPLGGKTGTTNESRDTWFVGFSPDLVVGLYIGFDQPKPLGNKETGSSVALPGFIKFMELVKKDTPSRPFPVPPGIQMVKVDRYTGNLPHLGTDPRNIIVEAFKTYESPAFRRYAQPGAAGGQVRQYQSPYYKQKMGQAGWPTANSPTTANTPRYDSNGAANYYGGGGILPPAREPLNAAPGNNYSQQYEPLRAAPQETGTAQPSWGGQPQQPQPQRPSMPASRYGNSRYGRIAPPENQNSGWSSSPSSGISQRNPYQRPAPMKPINRNYGTGGLY